MERNLMIAGFGGQGVMTMGKLLAEATSQSTDLQVSFFPSYGAAMRGGTANCYVVISDDEIGAPVSNNLDDLVVMNGPSLRKFLPNLKPGGNLFINSTIVDRSEVNRDDVRIIEAPVTQMALDIKNERALNVLMLGVYVAVTDAVPEDVIVKGIEHKFEAKPHLIAPNVDAFRMGIEVGLKEKAK